MTRRETFLLRALAVVGALMIVTMVGVFFRDSLNQLDSSLVSMRKQYDLLLERMPETKEKNASESLKALQARKLELSNRFYLPGEITIYDFSGDIQKKVLGLGLNVQQMNIDAPHNELSLLCTGELVSVLRFLHDVQLGVKSCDIRFMLLQRSPTGCQLQIRIGYVEIKT